MASGLFMTNQRAARFLDCASPLALFDLLWGRKSGRGLPQSKTLSRRRTHLRGSLSQCLRKKRKEALHEPAGSGAGVSPVVFGKRFALTAPLHFLSLSSSKKEDRAGERRRFLSISLLSHSPCSFLAGRERQNAASVLRAEQKWRLARQTRRRGRDARATTPPFSSAARVG